MGKAKKVLLGVVVLLVVIQFFHPAKNVSATASATRVETVYAVSPEVKAVLDKSCNDCHSNNTTYPWYNNIQPVGFWLHHHVDEGKGELNFDEFATYSARRQYHKLEETEEMVSNTEMPLNSYTWTHKDAILSEAEKALLINWTKDFRKALEAKYPIDSLVRAKK
jgi:hypothetical protein